MVGARISCARCFSDDVVTSKLAIAEGMIRDLPEIKQADGFAREAKFSSAISVASRALQISTNVPSLLYGLPARLRLARFHRDMANFAAERTERLHILKLLERPELSGAGEAGLAEAVLMRAVTSLAVAELRVGAVSLSASTGEYEQRFTAAGLWTQALACRTLATIADLQASFEAGPGPGPGSDSTSTIVNTMSGLRLQAAERLPADHVLRGDLALLSGMAVQAQAQGQAEGTDAQAQSQAQSRAQARTDAEALFKDALALYESQAEAVQDGHLPVANALLEMGGIEHVTRALKLTEQKLGADHWRVGAVLRVLAGEYKAKGDPISSEGLYRSAVSRLDAQPRVAHVEAELCRTLSDFAVLFSQLEWNGKLRIREALSHLERIESIRRAFPGVKTNRVYDPERLSEFRQAWEADPAAAKASGPGSLGDLLRERPVFLRQWVVERFSD